MQPTTFTPTELFTKRILNVPYVIRAFASRVSNKRMSSEETDRIINFVAEQTGVKATKVTLKTRLLEDLGLDGIDAEDFFSKFSKYFRVDMNSFDFDRHFGPEGCNPFSGITRILFWWKWSDRAPLEHVSITVSDLIEAAERGAWTKVKN